MTASSVFCCNIQGGDIEFEPTEEADDEETIDIEEAQEQSDSRERELELLREESEIPLEKLLEGLPPEMLEERSDESGSDGSEDSSGEEESVGSRYKIIILFLCFLALLS